MILEMSGTHKGSSFSFLDAYSRLKMSYRLMMNVPTGGPSSAHLRSRINYRTGRNPIRYERRYIMTDISNIQAIWVHKLGSKAPMSHLLQASCCCSLPHIYNSWMHHFVSYQFICCLYTKQWIGLAHTKVSYLVDSRRTWCQKVPAANTAAMTLHCMATGTKR